MEYLKLTKLQFFQHIRDSSVDDEDIINSYHEFVNEICNLYVNNDDYREIIFVLSYIDTELHQTTVDISCNIYASKAKVLIHKVLNNLQLELQHPPILTRPRLRVRYRWTESIVNLVELAYSLIELRSIEYGNVKVNEFATYLGAILGVEVKDASDCYTGTIKKRKTESRTYLLDKLSYALNKKMNIEDGCEPPEPPKNMERNLFDM